MALVGRLVMKSFIAKLILASVFLIQPLNKSAFAESGSYDPYPRPDTGYVSDHAQILSALDEMKLEQWLVKVEDETNVQIVVVTIESMAQYPGTANSSIESFAHELFDTYGIGNLPKNDGVLLLVSKTDRKARIQLGAHYAHLRDDDAEKIMQNVIIPKFKRGKYTAGITQGTEALINEFANVSVTIPWLKVGKALLVIGCILIAISLFMSGKRGWGYVFVGSLYIVWLIIKRRRRIYVRRQKALYRLRGGAGTRNSGSNSVRIGGGGFSGGGGSTGSW